MPSDDFEFVYYGANLHKEAIGRTAVEFWDEFTDRHDVYIIKHIDNPEPASNLLFMCQRKNKPVILDMDDNLFEVKPDQPAWEYYKPGTQKRAIVSALISMVDALFVSTQPLKDYYGNYLKKVHNVDMPIYVLPNYNDVKDWDFPHKLEEDRLVIGWVGSTTHIEDLKITFKALNRLLREYPKLEFTCIGGVSHEKAGELFSSIDDDLLDRIFVGSGTESWQEYPGFMSKQHIDIGIAPLTSDEFNRGKSHIKWMEYAMYKVPCVASFVYPYCTPILDEKVIVDGKTGLLANEKEWYYKLKKLVDNKELRESIGQNAYNYIKDTMQYKDHFHLWKNALNDVLTVQKNKQ